MAVVTVQGGAGAPIESFTFTGDALTLAQAIAAGINGVLTVSQVLTVTVPGTATVTSSDKAVLVNAPGAVTIMGGGSVSVIGGSSNMTFLGSSGATDVLALAGGANSIVSATSGSTTVVSSGAGNNISLQNSGSVDLAGGNNTVTASGASDQILVSGSGDFVGLTTGADIVRMSGSDATVVGGSSTGNYFISDTGTNNLFFGGTGAATLSGGSGGNYVLGTGNSVVTASTKSNGSETIFGSSGGSETVFGGHNDAIVSGFSNLTFLAEGGFSQISSSNGAATLSGSAGSTIFYDGAAGTANLSAGSGNETINAAGSGTTVGSAFLAQSGTSILVGGAGNDTFFGGSGASTLIGGGGSNVFEFINGMTGGTITILGFSGGFSDPLNSSNVTGFAVGTTSGSPTSDSNDEVNFINYGSNEVASTLATATTSGSETTYTLPDGTKLIFAPAYSGSLSSIGASNACFAAGTRIATPRGDIAVEALREGDVINTANGPAAIRWIGHRQVNIAAHPAPALVRPIAIAAGALADGIPARDLLLSPDHALFHAGVLIPAKALVNGSSVAALDLRMATYFHIELDTHAVIFAEGVAVESYLEAGQRHAFDNGGVAVMLHADFSKGDAEPCAPLVQSGVIVEALRRQIDRRRYAGRLVASR
jgi:Ca2+-binding RTX toxin-like protein